LKFFFLSNPTGIYSRIFKELPEALVDKSLVVDLLEDPPHGLHEPGIHGFIIILEINPSPNPTNHSFPLGGIPRYQI